MKKIYNFINGTQMLHLFGTYEQVREAFKTKECLNYGKGKKDYI